MASIIILSAVYETCFRDRSIDQLCMKHVSEIGVLIGCISFVLPSVPIQWVLLTSFFL